MGQGNGNKAGGRLFEVNVQFDGRIKFGERSIAKKF